MNLKWNALTGTLTAIILFVFLTSSVLGAPPARCWLSQSHIVERDKTGVPIRKVNSLTFRASIRGDFSAFDEETRIGLIVGNLNAFRTLGIDETSQGFSTIGEAIELGEEKVTWTRIQPMRGSGELRAYVKKTISRPGEDEDVEEEFAIERAVIRWNAKRLQVWIRLYERIVIDDDFLQETLPVDYDVLTPLDVPKFSVAVAPIVISMGDRVFTAPDPTILGTCRFNRDGMLTYARGRIRTMPLEETASVAMVVEIAEVDSRVETTAKQGSTMPWGTSTVPRDQDFHIAAYPNSAFDFNGWSCSSPTAVFGDPASAVTTVRLSEDATVYAHIVLRAKMKMAAIPESYGTTVPEAGTETVVKTEVPQAIEAIPADSRIFVRWRAAGKAVFADEFAAKTSVTLYGDATVTAEFAEDNVQILLAVAPDGTGTTNPGIGAYSIGREQPLAITAAPGPGHVFANWTINENGVIDNPKSAETKVTLTGPATVTAHFVPAADAAFASGGIPDHR